jgi:Protein of unknown function (DUF2911)
MEREEKTVARRRISFTTLLSIALAAPLHAQFRNGNQTVVMELPRVSQRAEVAQRIGLTDIRVIYHRPAVHGRRIWGKLVPYGEVWRTGANEITRVELSDPVTVEGHSLSAGAYGLHMIPGESKFTVIFSKNAASWGSFFYDAKDDALRVDVTAQPNAMRESLTYEFIDVTPDSTTLRLEWEKLAVPIRISVDTKAVVMPRIRWQLTSLAQYTSMAWDDAARFMLDQRWDLEEALKYAEQSLQKEEVFNNILTKAEILQRLGRNDEARPLFEKAVKSASAVQVHSYARQLQSQGPDEAKQALQFFEWNAAAHPDAWITHAGMARVYSAHADFDRAAREMKLALEGAPDQAKSGIERQVEQLQSRRDINVAP